MRTTFVFSCHFEGGWPRGRPPTDATSTSVLGLKAPKAKPTNERGHPSHQEKQDAKKGSMYSFRGRSVSRSVGRLAHAFRQSCFSRRGAERGSRLLLCAPFSSHPPSAVRIPETNNGNGANYTDKRVLSVLPGPIQCRKASLI